VGRQEERGMSRGEEGAAIWRIAGFQSAFIIITKKSLWFLG
jgi:hypothetical protein